MTSTLTCPIYKSPDSGDGWGYMEGMHHISGIITQRLNPDAIASASYQQILQNCQALEAVRGEMIPQLRSKDACKSAMDRLQYFAIRLHTSFLVSVCCRPALRRVGSRLEEDQKRRLADRCKDNLAETVKMFLAMHQLSVIPTRSWAFTYHGLSSAVLLGILGETKADPEVRRLQGDLISALSVTAAKEQTSPPAYIPKSDKDIELSGPLSRALAALKNIYDHGSINGKGLKKDEGHESGSTPLAISQLTNPAPGEPTATAVYQGSAHSGLNPHRDAALAMAEMQHGTGMQEFSG